MINKLFSTLKRMVILSLIISLVFIFSSCSIFLNESDEKDLSNGVITEGIIESTFAVKLSSYKLSFLGEVLDNNVSQGSGVIFDKRLIEDDVYQYFMLTNNHVIYKNTENYNRFEYVVMDCYGQIYSAKVSVYDANYDLAVVTFTSNQNYKPLEFASDNPKEKDKVVSVGHPHGIINAVTEGEFVNYLKTTTPTDNGEVNTQISNVNFEVIKHNAPINQGSSGGVLLDKDYKICGINYAAAVVEDSTEFVSGYAIPVIKVKQFLTQKYYQE